MKREGKTLKTLAPGDKRRLADARNAWRKMTPAQRRAFVDFVLGEGLPITPVEENGEHYFTDQIVGELRGLMTPD